MHQSFITLVNPHQDLNPGPYYKIFFIFNDDVKLC